MNTAFAQAIDPIILYFLPTLDHLGEMSADSIRDQLFILFVEADKLLIDDQDWPEAKYALAAWIDEWVRLDSHWSEKDNWRMLESELFETRGKELDAFTAFYQKASRSATLPGDALETFYVCALLGFMGIYRGTKEEVRKKLGNLSTEERPQWAADQFAWAEEMADRVKRKRGRDIDQFDEDRTPPKGKPLLTRGKVYWPWLLCIILAGANWLYLTWM